MYFDLDTALNQFRAGVEEKIRKGKFDKYGTKNDLLESNSYVYSNIRASLIQKTKTMRSGQSQHYGKFTVMDLEDIADANGHDTKSALGKAYVEEAKRAE